MADENVTEGTSADAEVPGPEQTEAEEPVALDEGQAEVPEAAPSASAEEPTDTEEPAAIAESSADESSEAGTSAQAEVPKKRKRLPRSQRRQRTKPVREKPEERRPITRLPKPERERGRSQERQGRVVSAAMDKTIVVRVDTVKIHPRYKKVIRRSSKFHAHDERNEAKVGDVVVIVETRPLSRMKRWRLQRIVEAAR
jgi:small subunit ribosomal protein S17